MNRRIVGLIGVAVLALLVLAGALLALAQDQETLRIRTPVAVEDEAFPLYLSRLLGRPLLPATSITVHASGAAAYPAMLAAIDAAHTRIAFETYIFESGRAANRFTRALADAARRGVKVSVVLDWVGAGSLEDDDRQRLEEAGVRIGWFNPLTRQAVEEVNYRTHRKILVVDGERAFVGGMGIADHWLDAGPQPAWRDTQIELRGPVAAAIEGGFHENWIETGGVVSPLVEPDWPESAVPPNAIVEWSSPEGGANGMKLLYLLAIGAARRTLDIQSPYLIVDESSFWSLTEARRRGVRVRLLVEGDRTDARPVKFASRADYARLLALGVRIAEYQPSMMHAKATIVDGRLAIVGSANFDNRSLELNDELNVAVFDRALASGLVADFERDWAASLELNLDEWRRRAWHLEAREWFWSLFGEVF